MLQGFCFSNHKRLQASCRYLQGAEPANMGPANTCPAGSWLLGLMAMNTGSQRFPRCCNRGNLISPGITRLPLVPLLRFPSNPPGRRHDRGNLASSGIARLPLVPRLNSHQILPVGGVIVGTSLHMFQFMPRMTYPL